MVWREAWAPKRAASIQSSWLRTVTPGIRLALFQRSVFSQSSETASGRTKMTAAVARLWRRANRMASSSIEARVHGQRGWATSTMVGRPGVREIAEAEGQLAGGVPTAAGEKS